MSNKLPKMQWELAYQTYSCKYGDNEIRKCRAMDLDEAEQLHKKQSKNCNTYILPDTLKETT
jgi:hypothetical protein